MKRVSTSKGSMELGATEGSEKRERRRRKKQYIVEDFGSEWSVSKRSCLVGYVMVLKRYEYGK